MPCTDSSIAAVPLLGSTAPYTQASRWLPATTHSSGDSFPRTRPITSQIVRKLIVLLEVHLHFHRPRPDVIGKWQRALPVSWRVRSAQMFEDGPGVGVGERRAWESFGNCADCSGGVRLASGRTGRTRSPGWWDRRGTGTCSPRIRAALRCRDATGPRDICRRGANRRRPGRSRSALPPRRAPAATNAFTPRKFCP